ncbi:hypothetical protein [Glycomyces buryatensis]|uniref:HTH luxR-type domain-containing protein n=1 Tax=Glycomyces buryatensis TaxID=2570927 RepID=A0A4S8QR42_9ACTN|nr:hypothetical protein [Glycomyces buryatensis]THV43134.1 hypothetical protein FAB82_02575 [Glycomyces buryatensis]
MTDNDEGEAATGLDEISERIYRLLLTKADASVSQLATESGSPPARTRTVLADLVEGGFATMAADSRFRAVAPDIVLGSRITLQLNAVRGRYEALRELMEIHRASPGPGGRDDRGRWEQVIGAVAIRSRLGQLRESAEHSVRTFVRPPLVLPMPDGDQHRELQDRGVRFRHLFDRAVLDSDPDATYLRRALEWRDEIRFAKRLPLKLVIIDSSATMIEETAPGRPRAIITANQSIVELTAALFEQLWTTAVPAPNGDPGAEADGDSVEPGDHLLLSLLIAGLTDQAIASKLGIGLRTVQRRVRELMDLADVDTRIQLGWHAAKHGWVP